MSELSILEKIAFNVIQGRVEAEDEGIQQGLVGQPGVLELVQTALDQGVDPKSIVLDGLSKPMEAVGKKYESGEYLIPDMLASAECVGGAMDVLGPHLMGSGVQSKGTFVLATVFGDLHDIGKNIVGIMLKGAGYSVVDLSNNVPAQKIVDTVRDTGASYLGLSALLTTTMREMGEVIEGLKREGLRDKVKILIGGAPTSSGFAAEIGADAHCRDAFSALDTLKALAS